MATGACAQAMEMKVTGTQLALSGPIAGDEVAKFRDLLEEHPKVDTIVLRDSPGGRVATAMRMGELIYERGFRTAVSGFCMSACVIVFAGGRERHFATGKDGNRTYLALHTPVHSHNSGWPLPGTTQLRAQGEVLYWIVNRIGPDADRELLRQATHNDHPEGFLYLFDHVRLKRPDGVTVFQCRGPEKKKVADCEKIPGKNARQVGLVTSDAIVELAQ